MKLPLVVAQQEVSGRFEQPEASLGLAAAPSRALAQTGQVLTQEGLTTAEIATNAQQVMRSAAAKQESQMAMDDFKAQVADREIELQRNGTPPDAYVSEVAKAYTEVGSQIATSMRYPEAQQQFMLGVRHVLVEKVTAAKWDAFHLQQAQIAVMDELLQSRDINQAVSGETETDRKMGLAQAIARVNERVAAKLYSPELGRTKMEKIFHDVQLGEIERDIRDPNLRPAVTDKLLRGGYEYLTPEAQAAKAKTLQAQSDEEYKASRAMIDAWWKDTQAAQVRDFFQLAANKQLNLVEFEQQAKDWRLSREDYAAIRNEALKTEPDPPSDKATLDWATDQVHRRSPTITEAKLRSLRTGPGHAGLNLTDYRELVDKLAAIRNTNESRALTAEGRTRSIAMTAYHDGLDDLRTRLGIPPLYEGMGTDVKQAWSLASQEYRRRAWPVLPDGSPDPHAEDPRLVVEQVAPVYLGMIGSGARADREKLIGRLKVMGYTTPEQVEADFRAKKITPGQRDNALNLFHEIQAKDALDRQSLEAAGGVSTTERGKRLGRPQ